MLQQRRRATHYYVVENLNVTNIIHVVTRKHVYINSEANASEI